jgi:hypothetical protein
MKSETKCVGEDVDQDTTRPGGRSRCLRSRERTRLAGCARCLAGPVGSVKRKPPTREGRARRRRGLLRLIVLAPASADALTPSGERYRPPHFA